MPHQAAISARRGTCRQMRRSIMPTRVGLFSPVSAAPVGFFTNARRFGSGMPDRERTYCGAGDFPVAGRAVHA